MNSSISVNLTVEQLYERVTEKFPYELTSTGYTQGDLENFDSSYREYSEEFTFEVGRMLNTCLIAGGWIDIRQDAVNGEFFVSGFFTVALNGDFEDSKILPDHQAVQAYYDFDTDTWDLDIDVY